MKKILILALSAFFGLATVSCSDFLTEEPATSILDKTAFSSQSGLEASVSALYTYLDNIVCGSNYGYYLMNGSLFQEWTGNRTGINWIQSHYLTLFSRGSTAQSLYTSGYQGVNRANIIIEGIKKSDFDEEYSSQIMGEARFLRAVFYFFLVRTFGDVPLVDFNPTSLEQISIPRTPYQEVYKFILDDLDYAEANMRTKAQQEKINPNEGRSYNFAATAFKVLVYAQIACYMESPFDQFFDVTKPGRYPDFSACGFDVPGEAWQASLNAAKKVISDPETPYALEPDYRNLFRFDPINYPEDYQSKERILVLQHTPTSGQSYLSTWLLPANVYGSLAKTGHASNPGRVRPNRLIWYNWCKMYGGVANAGGVYDTPTPDPRLNVTYYHTSVSTYNETNGYITSSTVYPKTTGGVSSSHYYRKYFSPRYNIDAGDYDYYYLRMGDIYLYAAEAANALGNTQEAIDYINALHKRARESVDDPSSPAVEPHDLTAGEFPDRESLDVRLMWERHFETDGELKAWYEIHRRGANWMIKNAIIPVNEFMNGEAASVQSTQWAYEIPLSDGTTTKEYPTELPMVRAALVGAFPDYELRYNTAISADSQNDFFIE